MKKNFLLKFSPFLILFLILFARLSFIEVNAQDLKNSKTIISSESASETEASSESSEKIFNKNRNTQKIADLKTLYRDQIEVYRNSEKDFNIAKTNYDNLQTLKTLEEAVGATKLFMKNRTKVLITYLELLKNTLDETAGIDLSLKNKSLKDIDFLINDLRLHQNEIALAEDRIDINKLADVFETYVDPYSQVAYRALSLIRVGKFQAVYDAASIIDEDIKKSQNDEDVDAVRMAKRERAYQEIQRNLLATDKDLKKINLGIMEDKQEDVNRYSYERILKNLGPVYTKMYKTLDYLDELLNL